MVALARRLARMLFAMWRDEADYQPARIRMRRQTLVADVTADTSTAAVSVSSEVVKLEEQARVESWPHVRAVPQRALLLLRILPCAGTTTCHTERE